MSERTTPRLVLLLVPAILCALAASVTADAQASRSHARAAKRQTTRPRTTSPNAPPAQTTRQTPAPSTAQTPAASPSVPEDDADLVIIANVTAKELKFETVPNPSVEFPGQPRRDTEWSAQRTNLPPQVEPGVTYRNVGIRLKIVSRFADIDRIVAEALGEIPTSDDAAPQAAPPPSSDAQPTAALSTQPTADRPTQPTAVPRDDTRPGAPRANGARQPAGSRKARARGAGRSR